MKGFRGKILVVDLSSETIKTELVNEEIARAFLGGAGYAVRYLYDLVDEGTDPLGPENPLFFMTGPLTGTLAPSAGRWVVCAKSPLSQIWGESNCGGFFGAELKFAGFDGILVKGTSEHPVYVWITNDEQDIMDASDLWGNGIYETHSRLKQAVSDKLARVACIGPAGENLVKYASIGSEERAAGRTGMGAVMGSKNLKAVVVRGKLRDIDLAHPDQYNQLAKTIKNEIMDIFTAQMMGELGTSGGVDMYNYRGQLPVKYWTRGEFDGAYDISGSTMKETILVRPRHCFACPIGCGRVVNVKEGRYKTPGEVEGPEYETVAGFGSQLLNNNLEAIAKANYLCNDYGIDTISSSVIISFVYYLVEKGIVSAGDLDGINPRFGDFDPALEFISRIAQRKGIGNLLAEGAQAVGSHFGVSRDEIATVDGMEVTYHDLRSTYGMAIAYATGPRGPGHNSCDMYMTSTGQPFPELDIPVPDHYDESCVMTDACARLQDYRAFYSTVIFCMFCNPAPSSIGDLISLATGWDIGIPEIKIIGERVFTMKRLFNIKMGLSGDWDTIPEILTAPVSDGGSAGRSPDWKKMLRQYYEFRKWDPKTGIPSKEKLEELGIHV
ncbi:MAG: aldehyde ferredoxin oxidoreductase family protein [Theionarchaea archaeon]|nr:aldehyde ferredoxin oxidoreductase family protein [Theionarchaea archaeon]MBU7037986.1 aldehyde ferredoxin oxidoreductase family protein [Theionarchaea archaeon]